MGIRKNQPLRKIDIKTSNVGGGLPLLQEEQTAPPATKSIPPPDTLALVSQGIQRSTQAPLAFVALSWNEAPNISPDYYNVEWSESSTFTDVQRKRANQLNATIDTLKIETTYYFRVQAVQGGTFSAFSSTLSVTTDPDLTIPPDPEDVIANFTNSDLVITWEKPVSEVYKDTKIVIYNNLHTVVIAGPFYTASERFVLTAEQNIYYTSNNPAKNVSVDVVGRSWSNVESSGVTVTATAALPTTPSSITTTWDSDAGKAPADFTISWLAAPNADSYTLTIDGNVFATKDTRFTYRYETNLAQHTPTLTSGDYALTWTVQSKDKLTQLSTAASGTAINMPPPSGALTLSTLVGFSTLGITASLLSNTIIHDFDHYEWVVTTASGIITHQSKTKDATIVVPITTSDLYTVKVRMVDMFNQSSPYTTASGIMIDTLNIDQLRAEAYYTDNLNNSQSTLAALKDGDSVSYVQYPATALGVWNWTNIERPLIDRYGIMRYTLLLNNALLYIRTTADNVTYRYFSGPIVTPIGRSYTIELTEYANEADAKTNAFYADAPSLERVEFPNTIEARNIRIFHRISGGSYRFGLLYPRRLLETDDLRAEEITSINIRTGGINADRIFATTLATITANIGSAHIDDILDIGIAGGIYQGTGTFASPTTGLKIYNVGGIGKLSTYNTGVEQITLDTDGILKAGAGKVTLNANGIDMITQTSDYASIRWMNGATEHAAIHQVYNAGLSQDILGIRSLGGVYVKGNLVNFYNLAGSLLAQINLGASGAETFFYNGVNIGTSVATGAAIGQLFTSDQIRAGMGMSAQFPIALYAYPSTHATSRRASLRLDAWEIAQDSAGNGTKDLFIYDTAHSDTRFHIDISGNIGLGAIGSYGGGAKVIFIPNRVTAPTTNPSGGGLLYVESGALKYRGSSGTVTTIANA